MNALNSHIYLAHNSSRLSCDALEIVKSFGHPVCKMECAIVSDEVARCATAFAEGGIFFNDRFLLIAPDDLEARERFIEKRGLLRPEPFMRVARLVFIRMPQNSELYRGEELAAFKEKILKQVCNVQLHAPRIKKKRRKWRYGRTARMIREREVCAQ